MFFFFLQILFLFVVLGTINIIFNTAFSGQEQLELFFFLCFLLINIEILKVDNYKVTNQLTTPLAQ